VTGVRGTHTQERGALSPGIRRVWGSGFGIWSQFVSHFKKMKALEGQQGAGGAVTCSPGALSSVQEMGAGGEGREVALQAVAPPKP